MDDGRRCGRRRCDPSQASYHTDGSLSSAEGAGARGGAARMAASGPCAPCGLSGGPHGGPRPRQPHPAPRTLAPPRPPPAPPPVRGWWIREAANTPCLPSASDWRCGRGRACRRRRYDGRSPRPAAAVPRRSGFVTPRPLPAQGRAGGWACQCPILWTGRCVQGAFAPAAPPFHRRRKPPACGGRPEGPGGFKSPPESNLHRPNHQGPRDHPAWHIGGAENKRPQRPHPPKGARPAHRPRRRPPSDDRPALGGRARRRRDREAAAPMAQRARRGPPDVGGPTGALLRPAAAMPARRRWPPARTPLLDNGTDLRHDAESVVPGLGRSSASTELRKGGSHSWLPRFDAALCGVSMASVDACPCAECAFILPRETVSVRA